VKNMQMGRIARMGEDEKFKRLKVFLEQKLKGVKFSTFKCLEREARDLKAKRIKNNSMAKRVAAFLEMKLKGIKYAIFSSFKRHAVDGKSERGEEDRLAALIAARDSASLQRLKIFLQGKEMRMKYGAFSWWSKCTTGGSQSKMEALLAEKRKARKGLEDQLRELERQLTSGAGSKDIQSQLDDAAARKAAAARRIGALEQEIENAKQRLLDSEAALSAEQNARREDKGVRNKLMNELEDAKVDKNNMEQELALIVDQIGFLSEYSR